MGFYSEAENLFVRILKKLRYISEKKHFKRLDSHLDYRIEVKNPEFISIGRVHIRPYVWIYAIRGDSESNSKFTPNLVISDGCSIGRFCHITCTSTHLHKSLQLLLGLHGYTFSAFHLNGMDVSSLIDGDVRLIKNNIHNYIV